MDSIMFGFQIRKPTEPAKIWHRPTELLLLGTLSPFLQRGR